MMLSEKNVIIGDNPLLAQAKVEPYNTENLFGRERIVDNNRKNDKPTKRPME